MERAAVLAIGDDHPGVVAGLTSVVSDKKLNIEVSHMATLSDSFSMMLVVSGTFDRDELEDLLGEAHPKGKGRMKVKVSPLPGRERNSSGPPSHVISVYSPEGPGVISKLSTALAERPINITHLHSQVLNIGDAGDPDDEYCVTRAFINLDDKAKAGELEESLRERLKLGERSAGGDVRVEPVRDVPAPDRRTS